MLAVEGATTTSVFEAYAERVHAPSLRKGQIVLMDNLGVNRLKKTTKSIGLRFTVLLPDDLRRVRWEAGPAPL